MIPWQSPSTIPAAGLGREPSSPSLAPLHAWALHTADHSLLLPFLLLKLWAVYPKSESLCSQKHDWTNYGSIVMVWNNVQTQQTTFLVLSMVNVSVYVFVSCPNYRVSSKTLCCNYHSPYWHLLLRRELISCRISLFLDPANKLHVTPTDVSGFKTVGTSWTVFPNLPGVNATIVEKLETFVRSWTKLWTNATVIYYFYSSFFKKKQRTRLQKDH